MSWQTNPAMIGLRNVARKTSVIQFINQFLSRKKNYEQAFDKAMFEAIKPCDVIWDVGANVGYYTRKFSDSVSSAGQVFAFEPFPATTARLRAELTRVETITVLPVALGAETGTVSAGRGQIRRHKSYRGAGRRAQGSGLRAQGSGLRGKQGDLCRYRNRRFDLQPGPRRRSCNNQDRYRRF